MNYLTQKLCPLLKTFGLIALVVVATKEEAEVELAIEAGLFSQYVRELYKNTAFSAMGRWLMIEVRNTEVLKNIKESIEMRVKSK